MADVQKKLTDFFPINRKRRLVEDIPKAGNKKSRTIGISHLSSPVKSPRKSPLKTRPDADLPLPRKYKLLLETFDCMNRSLGLIVRQRQQPSFDRLRRQVEVVTRRRFDLDKLLRLKTVFPDSFTLTYGSSLSEKSNSCQITSSLVITPTCKRSGSSELVNVELTPTVLVSRKKEMQQKLIEITKEHHNVFLQGLESPIRVDNKKLVQWHRDFDLDAVPDIKADESHIPVNPIKRKPESVADALERIPSEAQKPKFAPFPVNRRLELDIPAVDVANGRKKITSGPFKGLDLEFVQKFKAREAELTAKELNRSPEIEQKIWLLQQSAPMIRILRSHFKSERKTVLLKELVIEKIIRSSQLSVSCKDVDERLTCLTSALPDWIRLLLVKAASYVKILKVDQDVTQLEERIEEMIANLQKEETTA